MRKRVHARKRLETTLATALALAVSGCAPTAAPPPQPPSPPDTSISGTRVYVGGCVFRPEGEAAFLLPILGALLPNLINKGINLFGSTLDAAGKEQTWTATAHTNFEAQSDTLPRCVQVLRGNFAPREADLKDMTWAEKTPYEGQAGILKARRIYLTAKPDFFFEGVFRSAASGTALAIVPVVAAFERPFGTRALRGDADRHVKLAFAFHAPGKSPTDPTTATTDVILGKMSPGQFTRFEDCPRSTAASSSGGSPPPLAGGAPGAVPAPAPTTAPTPGSSIAVAAAACNAESLWFPLAAPERPSPFSVTTVVSETQGADAFLAFLADVFKESKDELEAVAKQALIESEREKARVSQLQADHDLAVAFDTAMGAVIGALNACSTDGTTAKAADALVKQRTANLTAEKASRVVPFHGVDLVPLTGDESAIKASCAKALRSIKS